MREGGPSALGDRQIYRQAVMETCLFKPPAKAFAGVYVGSYSCSVQPVIISCPAVTRPRDDTKPTKTRRPADGDGTLVSFMLCYVMLCSVILPGKPPAEASTLSAFSA